MIEIINRQNRYEIRTRDFRELLTRLIRHYDLKDPVVTLAFVNNKAIRDLNRDFLHRDKPTDVLSFPLNEKAADGRYYLGDIIISVPQAKKQALERRHALHKELILLTLHGFLHLMGYRHHQGMEEEELKIRNIYIEGDNGN